MLLDFVAALLSKPSSGRRALAGRLVFYGLLAAELLLSLAVVAKVPYTEIDWVAYMQEVRGFLGGELNYHNLRGDTGPLVYPAGFVYVYSLLYFVTTNGTNVLLGQLIFAAVYVANLAVVLLLYELGGAVPYFAFGALALSKRVHSLYMLRLFNDCVAVLLGYASTYLFCVGRWRVGCLFYSLAVSVKMNILLQAPGVLLVLLLGTAGLQETALCLGICAGVQLLLGLPFLASYPVQYLSRAFELSRVFKYEWTVNLKFLDEQIFVSKQLSVLLLLLMLLALFMFARKYMAAVRQQARRDNIIGIGRLSPHFIISAIAVSNFIGVVFARTLHYQFYSWYFHMLPYLLWQTQLPVPLKLLLLLGVEYAFNVFPATAVSSLLLQACHVTLLVGLYLAETPPALVEAKPTAQLPALSAKVAMPARSGLRSRSKKT